MVLAREPNQTRRAGEEDKTCLVRLSRSRDEYSHGFKFDFQPKVQSQREGICKLITGRPSKEVMEELKAASIGRLQLKYRLRDLSSLGIYISSKA